MLDVGDLGMLPNIEGDTRRTKQVLINLLSNAIKFTDPGGSITIAGRILADGALELRVTDTGIGMLQADVQKALTLFGQVDGGLDRNYEGAGLGLPISNRLMEAQGGHLNVTSQPGVGTTVTLNFPSEFVLTEFRRAG